MACAGYPGSTLQNCANTTNGFTGACCFAPEARVCVKAAAGRACAVDAGVGPAGTGAGAGGTSCPPPPRCADANPCAGFVGATADSCTDTADGFEATCCFAAGTLPITSGPSSSGGSSDGGVPAADAGMGGPDGGTGTGATGGGQDGGAGGQDGGAPPPCVAGAACTQGYKCDPGSSTSCTVCMCGADGHLTCGPCGATGTGATGGSSGGAGGSTGGATCAPGAACNPNDKCGGDVAGACMECMCGANGHFTCGPCGGTGATGGTTGTTGAAGTTGTQMCAPGAACNPNDKCGGDVAGACMECMCGADGRFTCSPCGGTGAGGTTGAAGTTGTQTCAPGAPCTQGFKCDPGSASCMICMCGADGFLACGPCGGTGATGGTTGAGGSTGGPASGPCQVNTMPAGAAGQPCSVMEVCPDGTDYRVRCDGNGACTCYMKGVPTAAMPTLSCNVDQSALVACGFPDGKI
jgi:hypothetical protein